jgi:uncharacterized membrane protein YbhN (UPF0104 family)
MKTQNNSWKVKNQMLKKIAFLIAKILISGSLMYYVLARAGVDRVIDAIKEIDPLAFVTASGIFIFLIFLCTIRWKILLHENFKLSRLFPLYMIGAFFNIFLPGLVGGDVVKIYYLYKETGKGANAMASVFMDRYMGYAGLMALGTLSYPFGFKYFHGSWIEFVLPAIVTAFSIVSLILFKAQLGKGIKVLGEIYVYFKAYAKKRGILGRALGISLCIHFLSSVSVYIISQGMGVDVPLGAVIVFVPIIATLAALPISISGLGIREAAFVFLYGTLGIPPEQATAVSFAWFLSYAIGGLPGIVAYLKEQGNRKKA